MLEGGFHVLGSSRLAKDAERAAVVDEPEHGLWVVLTEQLDGQLVAFFAVLDGVRPVTLVVVEHAEVAEGGRDLAAAVTLGGLCEFEDLVPVALGGGEIAAPPCGEASVHEAVQDLFVLRPRNLRG